ncbi:response regulator transcription factor [Chloroflexota bacterium]
MNKTRILVVDDELSIIKFLRANLKTKGYEVLAAMDGAEALQVIEKGFPDLIILDIMMPKMDGFEVCRRVREWSQVPIIVLSARRDVEEKAKCLNSGADDYITKPFGVNELIARVRAILRRAKEAGTILTAPSFVSGDLKINFVERRVTVAGRKVRLTPTEYNLLQALVFNAGKVFPHTTLLGRIWGPEYVEEREYLRVFIGRLRKELETDAKNPKYIITVPGVGYQFQAVA